MYLGTIDPHFPILGQIKEYFFLFLEGVAVCNFFKALGRVIVSALTFLLFAKGNLVYRHA